MPLHPYHAIDVVLLSMHDKTKLVQPHAAALGWTIHTDAGFDTDSLGTFSRDIPRRDDQYQTALTKAKLACQRNNVRFGLGSEGSVDTDPSTGLIQLGVELLVFYDATLDLAVTGQAHAISPMQRVVCQSEAQLQAAALALGFPAQQLVLFEGDIHQTAGAAAICATPIAKGIADWTTLTNTAAAYWAHGPITLETDYRAFACPGRQQIIISAAADLMQRLQSLCPKCQHVDFSVRARRSGLACGACHFPTPQVRAWVRQCTQCGHEQLEPVTTAFADPSRCPRCNP